MILIWDNGGSYSDHTIHFVECGELSPDDVVSFARLGYCREARELGRAEQIEWRVAHALEEPSALTGPVYVIWDETDDTDIAGITTPALEYLINTFPRVSIRLHEEHARRTE
jgi:hypothetical protein